MTRTGDDRAIGFVSAGHRRAGVIEIGYLFIRETWGKGIAHEAMPEVIAHLFAIGTRRIFADTDCWNGWASRWKDDCAASGRRTSACATP